MRKLLVSMIAIAVVQTTAIAEDLAWRDVESQQTPIGAVALLSLIPGVAKTLSPMELTVLLWHRLSLCFLPSGRPTG